MRTSWNVGLATCASEPVPRARPRTNVVLPAPRGPVRSNRSPGWSSRPSFSPSASVSAALVVVRSRKVVIAMQVDVQRQALAVGDDNAALGGQHADRLDAGHSNERFRSSADKLHLFPAGQRIL